MVAEACNGFGKTACSLSAALTLNRKIIYATRTHEQARQVLNEVKTINKHADTAFSAVTLASREHLCMNRKCNGLAAAEAAEACRLLRAKEECRYRWNLEESPRSLPRILSVPTLRKLGMREKICPYFAARKASEGFNIVVAPYQYIFNKAVREKTKLALTGKTLIFDEAHNADKVGLDALSDRLSERSIRNAEEELSNIGERFDFLDRLSGYLTAATGPVKSGSDFNKDIRRLVDLEDSTEGETSGFLEQFPMLVEEIREYKLERDQSPGCYFNGVLGFLSLVLCSRPECFVAVFRTSQAGFKYVEYRCLDPSLAVKPVLDMAGGTLIMSGTLSPLELFANVVGVEEAEVKAYTAIANPENVSTTVDTTVSTQFRRRDDDMILRYGTRILGQMEPVPKGVLIFFPQRKLLDRAVNLWAYNGILQRKRDGSTLGSRRLFIEGRNAEENRKTLEAYRKAARRRGAVLLSVFRGRNAEGTNFPDDEARAIFLVGVPYADYSDPVVRAQIDYFNRKADSLGRAWYLMDAFRAANQALGRGIRHRDDSCRFILMDTRYKSNIRMVAQWAISNEVKLVN